MTTHAGSDNLAIDLGNVTGTFLPVGLQRAHHARLLHRARSARVARLGPPSSADRGT